MSDLKFREETHDRLIWESVFTHNEYKLPEKMGGAVIVEIGGHVGAFAALCKTKGSAECWSIEPSADNFKLMCHNVAATEGSMAYIPILGAAWRNDKRGDRLSFLPSMDKNTGGGIVAPRDPFRGEVTVLAFDDLVRLASQCGRRRVNWVKLDCEGAEWPILFTSKMLKFVDHIVGEYHAGAGPRYHVIDGLPYTLDNLRLILEREGFEVEIEPPTLKDYNLFFAKRVRFGGKY